MNVKLRWFKLNQYEKLVKETQEELSRKQETREKLGKKLRGPMERMRRYKDKIRGIRKKNYKAKVEKN